MACIKLFLNELSLQYNLLDYVTWSLDQAPHAVIFGNTGSGKTYASKILLGRIAKHCPNSQFYVCDFKGDTDFSFLIGSEHFFRFLECEALGFL